jgi:hypothetical protein
MCIIIVKDLFDVFLIFLSLSKCDFRLIFDTGPKFYHFLRLNFDKNDQKNCEHAIARSKPVLHLKAHPILWLNQQFQIRPNFLRRKKINHLRLLLVVAKLSKIEIRITNIESTKVELSEVFQSVLWVGPSLRTDH